MSQSIGEARAAIEAGRARRRWSSRSRSSRASRNRRRDRRGEASTRPTCASRRARPTRRDAQPLGGIGVGVKRHHRDRRPSDVRRHAHLRGSPSVGGRRGACDALAARRLRVRQDGDHAARRTWTLAHAQPVEQRARAGSSSGSAAAVAVGHVPATIGTQTNGSIIARPPTAAWSDTSRRWAPSPSQASIPSRRRSTRSARSRATSRRGARGKRADGSRTHLAERCRFRSIGPVFRVALEVPVGRDGLRHAARVGAGARRVARRWRRSCPSPFPRVEGDAGDAPHAHAEGRRDAWALQRRGSAAA